MGATTAVGSIGGRLGAMATIALGLAAAAAGAAGQQGAVGPIPPATFDGRAGDVVSGYALPQFTPQGVWCEAIAVTPKWLVVQTAEGRQLPVSFDAIELFVMRWPTNVARLTPDSLVEVTGLDVNSNQVLADHVDVFSGQSLGLVTPADQAIIGYNRVLTRYDVDQMQTYGAYIPLLPGEGALPRRRHVVGPVVGVNPLALGVPGNTRVAVVPGAGGLAMSQVTLGSSSFVQPGDLCWMLPAGAGARTLALGQLVVYKSMPLDQFGR